MKPSVFIKRIQRTDYKIEDLIAVIREGLDCVFGKDFFKEGEKILLKPNFLTHAFVSEAITTHPNIIIATATILKNRGCRIFVADNPSGIGSYKSISNIYTYLGLDKHQDLFKLLFNNKPPIEKDGLSLSWWAEGFDKIVNMPKLKTHDLMGITAGVKNLFGFIPGLLKSQIHRHYPRPKDMAFFILDLWQKIKPQVNILDGIVSLEGQGPGRKGTPKKRGLIMISSDALCLDFALSRIIDLDYKKIPHLKTAFETGLGYSQKITTIPEDIGPLKIRDFMMHSKRHLTEVIPEPLLKLIKGILTFQLVIEKDSCVNCKRCIEICPQNAINTEKNNGLKINRDLCILCMCCREVCPQGCIEIKAGWLFKLLKKIF